MYYNKYIKYKNKYKKLKYQLGGSKITQPHTQVTHVTQPHTQVTHVTQPHTQVTQPHTQVTHVIQPRNDIFKLFDKKVKIADSLRVSNAQRSSKFHTSKNPEERLLDIKKEVAVELGITKTEYLNYCFGKLEENMKNEVFILKGLTVFDQITIDDLIEKQVKFNELFNVWKKRSSDLTKEHYEQILDYDILNVNDDVMLRYLFNLFKQQHTEVTKPNTEVILFKYDKIKQLINDKKIKITYTSIDLEDLMEFFKPREIIDLGFDFKYIFDKLNINIYTNTIDFKNNYIYKKFFNDLSIREQLNFGVPYTILLEKFTIEQINNFDLDLLIKPVKKLFELLYVNSESIFLEILKGYPSSFFQELEYSLDDIINKLHDIINKLHITGYVYVWLLETYTIYDLSNYLSKTIRLKPLEKVIFRKNYEWFYLYKKENDPEELIKAFDISKGHYDDSKWTNTNPLTLF